MTCSHNKATSAFLKTFKGHGWAHTALHTHWQDRHCFSRTAHHNINRKKVILKHRVNTLTTDRGQKHHEQLRGVLVPWCSLVELVAIWCVDRASQMSEAHSYWTVLQTGGGGKKKKVDSVKSAVSQKGRNKVVCDTIVSETSCIIHSTCTQTGYLHSS